MNRLSADEIRDALRGKIIGREIFVLENTTSTNDAILERTTSGTPEGLTIFAEEQTAGRGQRNNQWESARGKGLWLSILLRPRIDIGQSTRLAEWAAATVARTISEQFASPATVKLPNDVYLARKKVAGVLVEMRAQENAPHLAIVGIGVNVNHRAEHFAEELRTRAISLALALDREINRQQFAIALLRNLDASYQEIFAP
jgi:BirA family transcriptional regulator, biotin operon repressor / biotin---[acetyl-CoA-carboxylase] ligase